ncbi:MULTISPECIES: NADH-quinone oxidoreductase subunit L [Thalassobaculum]|uniref:NADH dehydrogenase subunit L n=1 Tax=Thalassobaculum litoreum DSM 18839 TaxID=1123362 RepID=A0A8G2BE66_9PROT|nr:MULTISPECIES: NADH-quinone oxidoreductase subunit L [Thalassobaculum]SDF10219.1 NADH dehydrogenase subunit L [Thalassobaculum litoreum DSM 18839]
MYAAIVFLPLIGALIAGFGNKKLGDRGAQIVTCGAMLTSAVLGIVAFWEVALQGNAQTVELFTWIDSGSFEASWALRWDTLTAVMVIVVTVVSSCVHVYSVGYMSHDPSIPRFMAYLSFFTFAMLMLVTSDNLIQMFFGWEGVGVASYLLIGFWYDRPSANAAAIKAFVVNRVGDFGFALGIFGCFLLFDAVSFDAIFAAAPEMAGTTFGFLWWEEVDALTVIAILLFIGAMGKSAQLGLHTWLPDAMEGPTPVSALIHAATMVTAGVFLVARMSPLFEYAPTALVVVTVVGAATAFFAATVGTTQNDIKRVIAYSTCSQLGYMFFALGVSAYPAAIFHLMTHAFFKALLFLSAGSVIHALHDEQDMRNMGGIWRKIPWTYAMFWIGSLALAGIPFFAGYYSKDMILESAFAAHTGAGQFAFWAGIVAALLTAFYSWRLLFMTFHGKPRMDQHTFDHAHESPPVMLVPLIVLAIGAVFSGFIGYEYFVGHEMDAFWGSAIKVLEENNVIEAAHHSPTWVKLLPLVVGVIGIGAAYVAYILNPGIPAKVTSAIRPVYLFLLNKWYFDELYDWLFVKRSWQAGLMFWKTGDGTIINGFGPDGVSAMTRWCAGQVARLQTGYLYHYAFAMLIGVVALVSWYLAFGG